ncbi:CbiX/SirB N-terminal domain-containing protein [Natribaculum luteum]|uniref:CbiX/SirB N-terminal domain-containing protein n=1 Tax=Natribaculum luteum TaxID=1586232 RepID=A0ABD5P661_9EURY|nr:CbiX/SirB N-terminal domain-containing protein [Natribaculum luteum]
MTKSPSHGHRQQYRPTNATPRALDRDLGVVLAAHGSHRSRGSGDPVYGHARRLRRRPIFDEVQVAFWQEEPGFAEVLRATTATHRFVVPLFASEGYFTRTVLPRELTAPPGVEDDVTITDPVGTAPAVTDLIASRALEVFRADDAVCDLADIAVAIVAHGAENDPRSAVAAADHAQRLRSHDPNAAVEAFYLEEPPYVSEVLESFDRRQIVAVPLFVGQGGHVTTDVPELLGLDPTERIDDAATATHAGKIDGRTVRYTEPIGTHPALADVAVRRVLEATTEVTDS